jgi:hypothetical protein
MGAIAELRGIMRRRAPGARRVWRFLTGQPALGQALEERFAYLCAEESEISEHLPTLRRLASECDVVVEFGTWFCKATTALALGARRKFISCDHLVWGDVEEIKRHIELIASLAGGKFEFIQTDTASPGIFEKCDLLFIDTLHTCRQLRAELAAHGNKAWKYLVLHDTAKYGAVGDDGGAGLQPAIDEFLAANPHWRVHAFYPNNNGLTVLKRKVQERLFLDFSG